MVAPKASHKKQLGNAAKTNSPLRNTACVARTSSATSNWINAMFSLAGVTLPHIPLEVAGSFFSGNKPLTLPSPIGEGEKD